MQRILKTDHTDQIFQSDLGLGTWFLSQADVELFKDILSLLRWQLCKEKGHFVIEQLTNLNKLPLCVIVSSDYNLF